MAYISYSEMTDMLNEAIRNLKSLHYEVGHIKELNVSTRYTRAWAKCRWNNPRYNKTFTITVSDRLFKANKESVRDIIHHEVIHTIPGCFNHGSMFKWVSRQCNEKYGTNISVSASEAEVYFGKDSKVENYIKYLRSLDKALFCNS